MDDIIALWIDANEAYDDMPAEDQVITELFLLVPIVVLLLIGGAAITFGVIYGIALILNTLVYSYYSL